MSFIDKEAVFQRRLAFGQIAETEIAKWLIHRGHTIFPVYDIEYDTGKGPRLFSKDGQLIAPDLLIFGPRGTFWIEAKHKSVFSWYRKALRWVTGIDLRHYEDYLKVQDQIELPVWLLFLHRLSRPDYKDLAFEGCPDRCPVGLFGNSLQKLRACESHRSDRHAKGMVYWSEKSLIRLASLKEVSPSK